VVLVLVVVQAKMYPGLSAGRPMAPRRLGGVVQHTVRPAVSAMVEQKGLEELVL
tara:strand:- start:535 stop:696 length:162 start_codon:yes stop_codon:yes gene_type:complete